MWQQSKESKSIIFYYYIMLIKTRNNEQNEITLQKFRIKQSGFPHVREQSEGSSAKTT